jgi:hypothetical protein
MKNDINIQTKKLELIQWLSTIDDLNTLNKIVDLKNIEKNNWYSLTSEEEKKSIEKGLMDADNGKLNPHAKARKIYDKWL